MSRLEIRDDCLTGQDAQARSRRVISKRKKMFELAPPPPEIPKLQPKLEVHRMTPHPHNGHRIQKLAELMAFGMPSPEQFPCRWCSAQELVVTNDKTSVKCRNCGTIMHSELV